MIRVAYAVCSESRGKPLTRALCDTRKEAEQVMARLKGSDMDAGATTYWIAELGQETAAIREFYEAP
ncbi:MAG: hypothetical protein ACAI38_13065 [Myxococcota bacterium]|nr:hypothetical protein [Myxococcota bacterium]